MADTPVTPQAAPAVPTTPQVGGPPTAQQPAGKPNVLGRRESVFKRVVGAAIQSGALLTFQYTFYKHDPFPLVLCIGPKPGGKVAGVNLHYLTFRYIKYLVDRFCGRPFGYAAIRADTFVRNSYRTYKREGLRNVRQLDCEFLNQMLRGARSYNPNEVEAMRQYIRQQLQQKVGKTADELVGTLQPRQPAGKPTAADGRRNPQV